LKKGIINITKLTKTGSKTQAKEGGTLQKNLTFKTNKTWGKSEKKKKKKTWETVVTSSKINGVY